MKKLSATSSSWVLATILSASVAAAESGFYSISDEPKKETEGETSAEKLPVPKLEDKAPDDSPIESKEKDLTNAPGVETFSAAVNVIRKIGRTEVVFRNGESYYLPSGSKYNEVYTACEESERTGKAVSVTVNTRSRTIISVGGAKATGATK